METDVKEYEAEVIQVGNSHYVNVPSWIIKYFGVQKGQNVSVKLRHLPTHSGGGSLRNRKPQDGRAGISNVTLGFAQERFVIGSGFGHSPISAEVA